MSELKTLPMQKFQIQPVDVLFFRDARPMEAGAGSGGHGANWPSPSLIFDAIHAGFHRAYPEQQEWEHSHRSGRGGNYVEGARRDQRFGSLVTAGPFPVLEKSDPMWLFPAPGDVSSTENGARTSVFPITKFNEDDGFSNLPAPLNFPLGNSQLPTKEEIKPWWSKSAFEDYLCGDDPPATGQFSSADLFAGEWTTGIGIDAKRGTQDGERLYSAEYLRLRDECHLGIAASMPLKQRNFEEGIHELFPDDGRIAILGGQQRACHVSTKGDGNLESVLPLSATPNGSTRVKWVLLSPALFPKISSDESDPSIVPHPGGWLPSFISAETGQVLLKSMTRIARERGQSRRDWRNEMRSAAKSIEAKLVAARIPKPEALTGYKAPSSKGKAEGSPIKETRLLVPAGAVYYFEADTPEDAFALSAALAWHGAQREGVHRVVNRRSTLMGEKGFGLGVCGSWQSFEEITGQ